MKTYCVKEKQFTESLFPRVERLPNGTLMEYSTCASCRITKTRFVSKTSGGKVDIHKAIKPIVPKGGITLPGTNYCGPYNRMDLPTTNKLDMVCRSHDICYSTTNKQECDKKMMSDLKGVKPSSVGEAVNKKIVQGVIGVKSKLGLGVKKKEIKWTDKLAEELHRQARRKFPLRRVEVSRIDDTWSADLVDMQAYSSHNKGYKYLLNVIDVFSKYAWSVPLKSKSGLEVSEGFKSILAEGRTPELLWVDQGSEFYNRTFKKLLEDNNIRLYHTFNQGKAVVIERFNRTLKGKMFRYFSANNTNNYIAILPKLINNYNNTKHSSTRLKPVEASKKSNENRVYLNLYPDTPTGSKKTPKFQIGDKVRISKKKGTFEKGYTPNWTEEVFTISAIQKTDPTTYKIKDLNEEQIEGSFYEPELQKTEQEVYRIEKIIRRDKNKKRVLVKWKGYPDEFNSWIPMSDLQSL